MGRVFRVEKELQRSYPRAWNQELDLHRFRLLIVDTVIRHISNYEIREHTIHYSHIFYRKLPGTKWRGSGTGFDIRIINK